MKHHECADGQRLSLPGQLNQAKPLVSKYRLLPRACAGVVNAGSLGISSFVMFLSAMASAMILFMAAGEISGS